MRFLAFSLLVAALTAPAVAAPPKANIFRAFAPNAQKQAVIYTVNGVTVRIAKQADSESPDLVMPVVTVSAKGMKPVTMTGESSLGSYEHHIGVGKLNAADSLPSVILQSYSGGAHCCTVIKAAVPDKGTFKIVSLGAWDGEGLEEFPRDISGDGVADFELLDNSFLYAFASYADSWAPPLIMNVKDGKAEDVSSSPAFRKLYEADLVRARKHCLGQSADTGYRNGACAAYGADAAMLGRYPAARAEIERAHQTDSDWDLPTGCLVPETDNGCPEGKEYRYKSFPEALDAFLKKQGYL